MKKALPFFLALPLAALSSAHAGTIIVSVLNSGDLDPAGGLVYNLDELGSMDWKIFSTSLTGDLVRDGGSGISDLSLSGSTASSSNSSHSPRYSWTTGAAPNEMATSTDPASIQSAPSGTSTEVFSLSAAATDSLRTLYVFVGVNRADALLTASLSDGSATAVTNAFDVTDNTFSHRTYRIDFMADAASGETLDITWAKTGSNSNGGAFIKFQGAALVPEPSAALLSLAGLGVAVLRRRR